jgi:type IV/VI secretion system ImpK/VasF family protein
MTSRNLWFIIEETMSRVVDLAVEARAAGLVAARRRAGARVVSSIAKGGAEVIAATEAGLGVEVGASPLDQAAAKLARDKAFSEGRGARLDIVVLRDQVRSLFQDLRATLAETLSEFDTFSALLPLVVYCDELVATATSGASLRWETLQGEFFETEDGGEKFYSVLDARLHQDETHPLVLQSFYYCLSAGFCGMYPAGSSLRDEIQSRLAQRIALPEIKYPAKARQVAVAEVARFPWLYYGVAAGVVLAAFVVLSLRAG